MIISKNDYQASAAMRGAGRPSIEFSKGIVHQKSDINSCSLSELKVVEINFKLIIGSRK